MELPHFKEIIYGQVLAKANHYMAVPGNRGTRRIIRMRRYDNTNVALQSNVPFIKIAISIADSS